MFIGCAGSGEPLYYERSLPGGLAQVHKPSPGRSMVVFIRPGIYGGNIGINVLDGRKIIAQCRPNSYGQYECDPGKHVFAAIHENVAFVEADLLPDRIYYAKVSVNMGWWSARANLWPLYPGCEGNAWQDLPKWLANVSEVTLGPGMGEWEAENRESLDKKYNAFYGPWSAMANHKELRPEHGLTEPIPPAQ